VIVEIDGATHGEPHEIASDRKRTDDLEQRGYRVFRAWSGDVEHNMDGVLEELLALLEGRLDWGEDQGAMR
jgi:very-short-patch-repair endonuclease